MKTKNYYLWLICIMSFISISSGQNEICTSFETGGTEGWTNFASSSTINSPALDGTNYLRVRDGSGPSWVYNTTSYPSNWTEFDGSCLCFDYKVFNDGLPSVANLNARIVIYAGTSANPNAFTDRAIFQGSVTITENDAWIHVCAPIETITGTTLPGNGDGQWIMTNPAGWNALLANIRGVGFAIDIAGSSAQTEIIGVDNICIQECDNEEPPTEDGSWCCDEKENLVNNGNFEFGDTGFGSDYSQDAATLPGQYDVSNAASNFGANITDPSFCADAIAYATNDKYLLVNGKTTQPSGSQSTIWEQTITNLDPEKEYRFCANFKNMPQCTFDILPNITIETSNGYSQTAIINTSNDPCDWQLESFCFNADQEITIRINLDEDGLGDGNDLAIDDIAVQELTDPNLQISVLHQGTPQEVTGSLNTIVPGDDILPYDPEICEDPYFWTVLTLSSATNTGYVVDWSQPYGYGNDTFGSLVFTPPSGSVLGPNWNLTTMYPGFIFQQNTLYLIAFYTPSCCVDCVDTGFTYQIIYNNKLQSTSGLSKKEEQAIIDMLGKKGEEKLGNDEFGKEDQQFMVYPNPAKDQLTVTMLSGDISSISMHSLNGQLVLDRRIHSVSNEVSLDMSSLTSGIYFLQVTTKAGEAYSKKVIKE